MHIVEQIISLVAPHLCIACQDETDRLLCQSCAQSMPLVPSRCYKCKAVTEDYAVCKTCKSTTPLRSVVVHTYYRDDPKKLVHRMKYERARQGTIEIGIMLTDKLDLFPGNVVLTHIPTATSRVRTRGYDHAKLIARTLAAGNLPSPTLLSRIGQAHQVGARRTARLKQLEYAFRPLRLDVIRGKHIVLVDDVLTTGATLETAARVLKRAGAKQVDAIVFAQA